jgi:hypothetical protein
MVSGEDRSELRRVLPVVHVSEDGTILLSTCCGC